MSCRVLINWHYKRHRNFNVSETFTCQLGHCNRITHVTTSYVIGKVKWISQLSHFRIAETIVFCSAQIRLIWLVFGKAVPKYREMELQLTKQSTEDQVIRFLQENGFEEDLIDVFKGKPNMQLLWPSTDSFRWLMSHLSFCLPKANSVDGEDFFDLDFVTINSFIPKLKVRKRFIAVWTKQTHMVRFCS